MFKKLSIVTLSVMGILLVAGCSNQSNSSTDTKPKTENTTKKDSDSSNKSTDTSDKTTDTNTNTNDNKTTDNNKTNNDVANNNSDNNTSNNNTNNNNTNNNNTNNQPTNITSGDQAMEYLMGKLTIDKTGVSALYNGTVTDDAGKSTFRINLYHSGDPSPFSAYNVYSDGTYTQVW